MAEAWLLGQEPYLSSREMGQSVDEVEKLIKRHEAFEKSAATWEERFSALERLTTVSTCVSNEHTNWSLNVSLALGPCHCLRPWLETHSDLCLCLIGCSLMVVTSVCVSSDGAARGEEAAGGGGADEEATISRAARHSAGVSAAEVTVPLLHLNTV